MEHIPNPVAVTDAKSEPTGERVLWANPAFYDLLGYPRAEPERIQPSRHYPTATRDELRRLLPTALAGRSIHGRSTFLRTDGSSFRADWTITPLPDAHGELRWWLMTGRDASEQEQIDALLAEQRALTRETRGMAKLSDMVAGVAHDFNNALTVIQNLTAFALEDLEDGSHDAGRIRDDLTAVLEAAADASDLARGLTAFGRRGAQTDQAAASFDFDRIVQQIVSVLRRALPKRIDITTDLACEMLVESSESMLQQVLYNLLVNAGAAIADRGSIQIRSRAIRDERGQQAVELCVSDDGVGMTEAVKARVLEPYFTTKGDQGSGLGLPTVNALVEQHRGHLRIDSEPGRGTRVRVILPVTKANGERPAEGRPLALVVDDDPMILKLLSRLLARYGYDGHSAATGADARNADLPKAPELIIVDLALGRENGVEVGQFLRERYPGADLVLTTGGLLPQGSQPLFPFAAVLRKPFTSGDVGRMLRQLKEGPGD
ncbi:MAG: response regulator [Gammaproteobacteria bacterium]|nr:response regulator [Gammaproteobacteria bacterium]